MAKNYAMRHVKRGENKINNIKGKDMKDKMKKMFIIIEAAILVAFAVFFVWQMNIINRNFDEKIQTMNLMISRYEAKAQFVEQYLPLVEAQTGSKMIAQRILSAVYENALQSRLETELLLAVIQVESEFNPNAYSDAGAIGLMQIMPVTGIYVGRSLGLWIGSEDDLYDIETNIQIGTVFLKECIERLGEHHGLGFYYAGRYIQSYKEYTDKIADAKELWMGGEPVVSYRVQ
jgi:soluble lytic murein transglycosylase-like protein